MKRNLTVVTAVSFAFVLAACSKEARQAAGTAPEPAEQQANTIEPDAEKKAESVEKQGEQKADDDTGTVGGQTSLKHAQSTLKDLGLYTGAVDGKDGPKTQAAIKQFQSQRNLDATGKLDSNTMNALTQQAGQSGGR